MIIIILIIIVIIIFISAVRVREEAAAQTLTAARISPVRPEVVVHHLYQVSLQSPFFILSFSPGLDISILL